MDTQEKPQAPAAEPQAPAEPQTPAEPQAQATEAAAPTTEQAQAPTAENKGPRFTTLKILGLAYVITVLLYTPLDMILKPTEEGVTNTYSSFRTTYLPIIIIAASIFISYLLISAYNRKKYGANAKTERITKNAAKRAGSIVVLTVVLSIAISFLLIMLTGLWASNACKSSGSTDCAVGWFWGFLLVPGSVLFSFIISPFISAAIVNKAIPKDKGINEPTKS